MEMLINKCHYFHIFVILTVSGIRYDNDEIRIQNDIPIIGSFLVKMAPNMREEIC